MGATGGTQPLEGVSNLATWEHFEKRGIVAAAASYVAAVALVVAAFYGFYGCCSNIFLLFFGEFFVINRLILLMLSTEGVGKRFADLCKLVVIDAYYKILLRRRRYCSILRFSKAIHIFTYIFYCSFFYQCVNSSFCKWYYLQSAFITCCVWRFYAFFGRHLLIFLSWF